MFLWQYNLCVLYRNQKEPLNNIHNESVNTPTDRANGNVAFICQRELGLDQNTTSTKRTYIQVNKANNRAISDQTTFFKSKFDLQVNLENKPLPNIF